MEPSVPDEGLVAPGPVNRNAQELGAMFTEFGENFVVKRHLIAANRAPVRRIEGKDHGLAAQILQREPLIRSDAQLEVRSGCSFRQDVSHVLFPIVKSRAKLCNAIESGKPYLDVRQFHHSFEVADTFVHRELFRR
jgi:hypothetical protein